MHPFYFGTSQKQLFGVYHPPRRESDRHRGVVICYPFGQEYMRGHRAFRQLGLLLSRAGFHVLRFDYYGTGDSAGNAHEVSIPQWIDDAHAAIDELKDMADLSSVAVVGTRLGAAVAVQSAARRNDVNAIVLWDPVASGARYLAEIADKRQNGAETQSGDRVRATVYGFPITDVLWEQLQRLDIRGRVPRCRVKIVVSSEQPAYAELRSAWATAEYSHIPSKGNWNEVDNFGSALVPQEIIRDIVTWFEAESPVVEAVR